MTLPLVLVIDDLFGRVTVDGTNPERASLCEALRLHDVTEGEYFASDRASVSNPACNAVFCRGQTPTRSDVDDVVRNSVDQCIAYVDRRWATPGVKPWSMVLLDMCFLQGKVTKKSNKRTKGMPEGLPQDRDWQHFFGLALLDELHKRYPELPIVILSATPRDDVAKEFNRRGALGFIDRKSSDAAGSLLDKMEDHALLPDDGEIAPDGRERIIGYSIPLLVALRNARQLTKSGFDIMLRGERGTGKELFAKYLHQMRTKTDRNRIPFVPVSSAVFTQELFQSELFGIMANIATGVGGRTGLIDGANGGDLFLDEIGDMPANIQAALLRFLEVRLVRPVGATNEHPVDIRAIAATEVPIEDIDSKFRTSLGDRFGHEADWIFLPPLRDRSGDMQYLAEHFLGIAVEKYAGRDRSFLPETLDAIASHPWPGNIRELSRRVDRAVRKRRDAEDVTVADLELESQPLQSRSLRRREAAIPKSSVEPVDQIERKVLLPEVLDLMRRVEFPIEQFDSWVGGLDRVEKEMDSLRGRMLSAAIGAGRTKRSTENPSGEVVEFIPQFSSICDTSTGRLPNGNKVSNSAVTRAVASILAKIPDSERDENLKALQELKSLQSLTKPKSVD